MNENKENNYIKSDFIKPYFSTVKERWHHLLSKYFNDDGNLSEIFTTKTNCPHCTCHDFKEKFELNKFIHQTCINCDCVYVSPRLNDSALEELYSDDYYSELYATSMIPFFERRKKLIGINKFNQTISHFSKINIFPSQINVLDIGAGVGEVICTFQDQGFNCEATEMNKKAVSFLRSKQIIVFDGIFDDFPEKNKYDIIMAWGVVEHVINPKNFLNKAFRLLNDEGIFVSEVPNSQSLLVDYCRENKKDPTRILMGEQHILLYSISAYEELHTKSGFEKIHIQTNGLDLETILSIEKQNAINDNLVLNLQKQIDLYMKGDLIRGFWKKKSNIKF
ncbi:class I SAM-dependent methyltransferase [Fluviispira multicolorata]|uniref:Methyltransferase domain-containing protein n=1 Tax=Fluviispira multicolorata TaxID=2654512 RepID=A0A833JAF5_9BACT|nr:class I SAM-dependent methyltransferase [Fluviispira multicolorata]KAB8028039.1 methyltransferase domain-containing protein [Fluviispira multicolorata]